MVCNHIESPARETGTKLDTSFGAFCTVYVLQSTDSTYLVQKNLQSTYLVPLDTV